MPTVSEITLSDEIEEAIQNFAAGVRSEEYGEDADDELNALRAAITAAIAEADASGYRRAYDQCFAEEKE